MTTTASGRDRIILEGLQFFAAHGAWAHEKLNGQRFVVDLRVEGNFETAGASDDLADALDYTRLYEVAARVMSGPSVTLIEALAQRIACDVLAESRLADACTVRVAKPGASIGGVVSQVAVEVRRYRRNLPGTHDAALDRKGPEAPRPASASTQFGSETLAVVALGSNLGCRLELLNAGVRLITAQYARLIALSRIYETAPVGGVQQGDYLNAAILVATTLEPLRFLDHLLQAEKLLGRVRAQRWGPRTLDADLVAWGDVHIDEPRLVLPHPRAHERAFVMQPVADVFPGLLLAGETAAARAQALPSEGVRATDLTWADDLEREADTNREAMEP